MYEHLNLKSWPFQIVPDADFARIWAGRRQTRAQIETTLQKIQISSRSGLHLLWASFGMGKTHTLLHLRYLCQQTAGQLVPVYTVMPNRPTSFLDLYRAIVSELPLEFLGEQLIKVGSSHAGGVALHPMFARSPGVVSALLAMRGGDIEKTVVARQWLAAQPGLAARDLRMIGVNNRIKTAEDAVQSLTALTKLATFKQGGASAKLVIMVDEYQRIGELSRKVRDEVNAGIHTYFNMNATGLELILSFSFGRADNVKYLLSPELKSRAEGETISLSVLTPNEALEFMQDLLLQFRIHPDANWAHPFTPDALKALIQHIAKQKAITPRRLMKYGDYLLAKYAIVPIADSTAIIETALLEKWLDDPDLFALDDDEQAS